MDQVKKGGAIMKISAEGVALIRKWEGFHSKAYKDPVGVWTIGYGTTRWASGVAVKQGDMISQADALKLLEKQINEHASTIPTYVKRQLSQCQFDALASFQYNLGKHILSTNKTLLNALNGGNWSVACSQMLLYNKGRINGVLTVLNGLTNRRKEEVAMFNKKQVIVTTSKHTSIVDYLKSKGMKSDFTTRSKLAIQYGIKGYIGSAEQNTKLLNLLQK